MLTASSGLLNEDERLRIDVAAKMPSVTVSSISGNGWSSQIPIAGTVTYTADDGTFHKIIPNYVEAGGGSITGSYSNGNNWNASFGPNEFSGQSLQDAIQLLSRSSTVTRKNLYTLIEEIVQALPDGTVEKSQYKALAYDHRQHLKEIIEKST